MKKILLLTLVVAFVGTAFADTDPVFSGSFKAYYGLSLNAEEVKQSVSDGASLDLKATIDEWNTVSVKFSLADAMYWDDVEDDDKIYTSIVKGVTATNSNKVAVNEIDNRADYLRMTAYTWTSDILGALGVDGPVGITAKFGKFKFGTSSVVNVAPLSTKVADGSGGTAENEGIGLDFKFVDMVTLSTVIYPKQLYIKQPEFGVSLKATGIAGMIDASTYFIVSTYTNLAKNPDDDKDDEDGDSFGISVSVKPADIIKFGLGFEYNLEEYNVDEARVSNETSRKSYGETTNRMKLQADIKLMLGIVDLGLSYGINGLDGDENFAANNKLKLSGTVKLGDNFSLFGGVGLEDFRGDIEGGSKLTERFIYDAGFTTALGKMAIQVGMSHKMNFKASEDDFQNVLYAQFSTSF